MNTEMEQYLDGNDKVIGLRIPAWLLEKVKKEAKQNGSSISDFIRRSLVKVLSNKRKKGGTIL